MWRLVDYSTMSNETAAGLTMTENDQGDMWLSSWMDLFGRMDAAGFTDGTGDFYDSLA